MLIASAVMGSFCACIVALVLKHVDLRRNPSLEFGIMLLASYFPYCLAEATDLSVKVIKYDCKKNFIKTNHKIENTLKYAEA